jgi:hypothetical protein
MTQVFPRLPSGSPKIKTFVVSKLWTFISSSNQTFLEHARVITYIPQKDIFNDASYAPIGDHLTHVLRGFVAGNQTPYLTFGPSFDHNSCISGLNE